MYFVCTTSEFYTAFITIFCSQNTIKHKKNRLTERFFLSASYFICSKLLLLMYRKPLKTLHFHEAVCILSVFCTAFF